MTKRYTRKTVDDYSADALKKESCITSETSAQHVYFTFP